MADQEQSDIPELFGETLVYGLKRRKNILGLIEELQTIPCKPCLIFRINARRNPSDRVAKWFGVDDALAKVTYYVRIHYWGKNGPVIGWSLRPHRYSRSLKSRALQARIEYETALRLKPLVVRFDAQTLIERCAKTPPAAS